MNKAKITTIIAKEMHIPVTTARKFVECFLATATLALQEDEELSFFGFGSLRTRKQDKRLVRNPRTGEPIMFTPRTTAYFKPGKFLLNALNKQK